jgi:hypothetical protein
MDATFFLRPVHAWCSLWDRLVPSIYRVVATGLAALATALILVVVGVNPLLAAPAALAAWIALAVAQEHDQRILVMPDRAFVAALTEAVSVPPLSLTVDTAHGPPRAEPQPWDTMVVLTPHGAEGHPLVGSFITVERSEAEGWMAVDVVNDDPGAFEAIDDRLHARGEEALAERIEHSTSPDADAHAIAAALLAAYW